MDTINVKLSGLKPCNLSFAGLSALVSKELKAPVVKMEMVSDDVAYAMLDISDRSVENPVVVHGGNYSFTTPEGEHITVSYVADESGFRD